MDSLPLTRWRAHRGRPSDELLGLRVDCYVTSANDETPFAKLPQYSYASLSPSQGLLFINEVRTMERAIEPRAALLRARNKRAPELHAPNVSLFSKLLSGGSSSFYRIHLYCEPYTSVPDVVLHVEREDAARELFRALGVLQNVAPPAPAVPSGATPPSSSVSSSQAPSSSSSTRSAAAAAAAASPATQPVITGGLAGILHRESSKRRAESSLARDAFRGDLDSLTSRADAVLEMIRRYSNLHASTRAQTHGEQALVFDDFLADVGVVSRPVTKGFATSETRFRRALAQELASCLDQYAAKKSGGVYRGDLTLTDIYALLHRVRGGLGLADLVSPEDFLGAARALNEDPSLGYELREAASGVKSVRPREGAQDIRSSVSRYLRGHHRGITAHELLTLRGNQDNLALCRETLEAMERDGALVRDASPVGPVAWWAFPFREWSA